MSSAAARRHPRPLAQSLPTLLAIAAVAVSGAAVSLAGPHALHPVATFTSASAARPPRTFAARAATVTPVVEPTATAEPSSAVVPSPEAVAAATRFARARKGIVGFAVIDSRGGLHGYRQDQPFVTASVVKAMLLVGYLRTHATLDDAAHDLLSTMIETSDNDAATRVYGIVGDAGLRDVAKAAGMTHFSVRSSWGYAQLTPADQARFFRRMDALVPTRDVGFARSLLSGIVPSQSWGIPAACLDAGWNVFFKGGWRTTGNGQLVHQVARLERGGDTISIAVMTDGDPDMAYGIGTIAGITQRLLPGASRGVEATAAP